MTAGTSDDGPGSASPGIVPLGDAALLVTLGEIADPVLTARARTLAAGIDGRRGAVPAIGRPVPAHASVLVPFDPLGLPHDAVAALVEEVIASMRDETGAGVDQPPLEIEVVYGGDDGPDLDDIADRNDLTRADVVELHAGARFVVLFLGFAPGFAYLGGLPDALATPRRPAPRERVPAGSVGISGAHSAVYPLAMPGGWNLIGRTDAVLFDPHRDPPTPLRPGRTVRFVPRTRG